MAEKVTSNAIEQYLEQARLTNDSATLVDLVKQIIESANIYSFSEFLESPNFAQLQNTNFKSYYELLKLFAYGTYLDYINNKASLPELNTSSIQKLRHLSIISLASKCRTIPYSTLQAQLGIANVRELEDLIIDAFYADIIKGKLDQQHNQLEIDFSIGRDVTNEQIDEIINILDDWCSNCGKALETIEKQISNANQNRQKQIDLQNSIEAEVINMKKTIKMQNMEVESMNVSIGKDGDKSGKKASKSKYSARQTSAGKKDQK